MTMREVYPCASTVSLEKLIQQVKPDELKKALLERTQLGVNSIEYDLLVEVCEAALVRGAG
jgi:hypothetical protein